MKTIDKKTTIIAASTLIIGVVFGWLIFSRSQDQVKDDQYHTVEGSKVTIWTCAMHPQIRSNEPGKCPICGMELIPLENSDDKLDPMAVSMSPTAMQLASVQTSVVNYGNSSTSSRLNGKVQADERRIFTQSSHLPGRIEELTVNFTGDFVKEGEVIAYVYSPDLVSAQEELFEALKIKETQPALFQAAKQKLINWKLSEKQIEGILSSNITIDQFPILANVSGYITKKMVNLGDYVKQGQAIYEITDLSKVWVLFDVYESDMSWVKKGDKVQYTIESLPGETFTGYISYIDPTIDPNTRVAKARIEAPNRALNLKPEMFVTGTIESNPNVKTNLIIVPKSAVMWTGKRSLVYVKNSTASGVSFMMRQVTLGEELGASFVIESGLQPGEEIAVNGTFSIDAAAQLAGKPSMMNPEGGASMTGHNHGSMPDTPKTSVPKGNDKFTIEDQARESLKTLFTSYFEMKQALSSDDFETARKAGMQLNTALENIDMSFFKGASHKIWMDHAGSLKPNIQHLERLKTIEELRSKFMSISSDMIALAESFQPLSYTLYVQHCPMANSNKGADWLSKSKEIENPYFGQAMFNCGETTETIKGKM